MTVAQSKPVPLQLLLIGGRSGAGKTSVAYEVSLQLQAIGVAHCHIEGDNLDAAYPKAPDDPDGSALTATNLTGLWRGYRAIGHHRLIYVNTASVLEPTMLRQAVADVDATDGSAVDLTAVDGSEVEVVAVELTARDDTVAARLTAREVGSALQTHLRRSRHMARLIAERASRTTVRIATDGKLVAAVAAEVVAASGWAGGAAASR